MGVPLIQVDAFTDRPFAGNPAAVCLLEAWPDDRWLQDVAAEMNLAETAFVREREDGFDLRWFTPAVEVDLCGHATLAAAHVLWEEGRLAPDRTVRFHTRSGVLSATRQGTWIAMDFPAAPAAPVPAPPGLVESLGLVPRLVGQNRFDYLVEAQSEEVVRSLAPDLGRLAAIPTRGVMVTARGAAPYHFVSRFFAPRVGIPEDPVTGSAHCCLGPFWGERLGLTELLGYQASPRGGVVRVSLRGERVGLGGQAVTVLRGRLG